MLQFFKFVGPYIPLRVLLFVLSYVLLCVRKTAWNVLFLQKRGVGGTWALTHSILSTIYMRFPLQAWKTAWNVLFLPKRGVGSTRALAHSILSTIYMRFPLQAWCFGVLGFFVGSTALKVVLVLYILYKYLRQWCRHFVFGRISCKLKLF